MRRHQTAGRVCGFLFVLIGGRSSCLVAVDANDNMSAISATLVAAVAAADTSALVNSAVWSLAV